MYSTGIFTTFKYVIDAQLNTRYSIIPFGDVHKYSHSHSDEKWSEFLENSKKTENAYFVGMGDLMDWASASERVILGDSKIHDSTRISLDDYVEKLTQDYANELSFMKGRLIGLIEGNHYWQFPSGLTSTQRLCQILGCKYLGVSSFIRVVFRMGFKKVALDMWLHHGKGASKLVGGSLNRVEDMARFSNAQIFLMGHDHRKSIGMTSRLVLKEGRGNLKLSYQKIIYARTGSFLKGYIDDGKPNYVVDACMNPLDLGTIAIHATPVRKSDDGEDCTRLELNAVL